MRIYRGFEEEIVLKSPVVAVGSFDGVHLGHRRILQYLVRSAQDSCAQSVVVTFDPHPQKALHPESDFFVINTLDKNLQLIEREGVDAAIVIPFTPTFSKLSYVDFVEQYLIGRVHAGAIVMGPNHAIGHNREGNHALLTECCLKHGVRVVELPELLMHEVGVHSSKIRKAIMAGDLETANEMLGYRYEGMKR